MIWDDSTVKVWVASCKQRKNFPGIHGLCVRGANEPGGSIPENMVVIPEMDSHVPITDKCLIPLPKIVECIVEIDRILTVHRKIVIYCGAGANRSYVVTAAWLMKKNKWTFEQAKDFMMEKRRGRMNRETQTFMATMTADTLAEAAAALVLRQAVSDCLALFFCRCLVKLANM